MTLFNQHISYYSGWLLIFVGVSSYAADVDGVVDWGHHARLSTAVPGIVAEVPVHVGQLVKSGQVLLRLEQRTYLAALEAARTDVAYRETTRQEAKLELQRAKELFERKMLADHELATSTTALAEMERNYSLAQAALAHAEYEYTYSQILSPYNGIVIASNAEVGQFVQTNVQVTTLIEIGETAHLSARAIIGVAQAAKLVTGSAITVSVAGKRVPGNISDIYPTSSKGKYTVVAHFENNGLSLRPGDNIKIQLP